MYLGENVHLSVRLGKAEGVRRSLGHEQELDRSFPVTSVLAVARHHFRASAVCTEKYTREKIPTSRG